MATVFRGVSGSQIVYSTGSPPVGATLVSIIRVETSAGGTNRGTFGTVFDLPNAKSSSNTVASLNIGDFATVVSEGNKTFFCSNNTEGFVSWSLANDFPQDFADNLAVWWEADRGVTLSGSSVIEWQDWFGNIIALTSSGIFAPTYNTGSAVFNDNPSVSFDGTNHRMSAGNVLDLGTDSMTWFVAMGNSNPSVTSRIFNKRGTGGFGTVAGYVVSNFGADGNFQNSAIDDGNGNSASPSTSVDVWGDGNFHVLTIQMDSGGGTFRGITDGGSAQAATTAGLVPWNITSSFDFVVGSTSNDAGQEWPGEIAAIVCYRGYVTGSKREAIEQYLRNKYKPESDFSF